MTLASVVAGKSLASPLMIAHAGGGYKGQNYTNSIEALNENYLQGFRYFEIDFSWTSDNQLVCMHDWGKSFKKLFGYKIKKPLSYSEFIDLADRHQDFEVCTLSSLAYWLMEKPDAKIITDIKHRNLDGLAEMVRRYPQLMHQIIPQFFQPEEYPVLLEMGFKDLIWILYQYKGSKKSVLSHARDMDLFAVSMQASQARSRTLQKLLNQKPIFVYTINNAKDLDKLRVKYGVSGFYTDFLPL